MSSVARYCDRRGSPILRRMTKLPKKNRLLTGKQACPNTIGVSHFAMINYTMAMTCVRSLMCKFNVALNFGSHVAVLKS